MLKNLSRAALAFTACAAFALPVCAQNTPSDQIAARNLPPLLRLSNGTTVQTASQWATRRAEILEVLAREEFGRSPSVASGSVSFTLLKRDPGAMGGAATLKQVRISITGPRGVLSFELVLFTPNNRRPAPTLLLISHRGKENLDPTRATKTEFWPAEELVARGYGAAAFFAGDVDPDVDDGFQNGVHGIFDPVLGAGQTRARDAWGTLAAWSFGASRALDYLVTDSDVDKTKIGVIGHSRGGKAALWAGATDTRFALTISNCSGQSGAALSRGKTGETIKDLNDKFPHWFDTNYKAYNGRESALPFDQHWLIGAVAPRLAYVVSAQDDAWSDPKSEFLGAVAASPAWTVNGQNGLIYNGFPQVNVPLQDGQVGYHMRSGAHDLTSYDWNRVMDFCNSKWRPISQLPAIADNFVRDGSYANTAYPTDAVLNVKNTSGVGGTRWAYLKFDTTGLGTVTSAKLRFYSSLSSTNPASVGVGIYGVQLVSGADWSESSLTWNNKPATGVTALASPTITGTTGKTYEVDVTSWVQSEISAGRRKVGLALKSLVQNTDAIVLLNSSENSSNPPVLIVQSR